MLPALETMKGVAKQSLQQLFLGLMELPETERFPGSQPVSFERKHLDGSDPNSPFRRFYYAAEKTDGVRYMLLVAGGRGAYMVDRNFEFRRLPAMHFPSRRRAYCASEAPLAELSDTLLDGELVLDTKSGGGGNALRYLAYDACAVGGKALTQQPLPIRLLHARRELLAPRYRAMHEGHDFSSEPFPIELKDFFEMGALEHIFEQVSTGEAAGDGLLHAYKDPLRSLAHGNDGIIFTPVEDTYEDGTCRQLLKWKPAEMNSIDFQLATEWRGEVGEPNPTPRFKLRIASNGVLQQEPFGWITFPPNGPYSHDRFAADADADRRIVECVWDAELDCFEYAEGDPTWDNPIICRGGWRCERVREDKDLPNDKRVVQSVQQSAQDGVTKEQLMGRLSQLVRGRGSR